MNRLIKQIKKARLIFICGNGGSAALSDHFATDLIKKGYPAISLSSNSSVITMIANDYGYQYIFSKQIESLGSKKDLLIIISCSGTSLNILEAQKVAKKIGMEIYQFGTFKKDRDYEKLENEHLVFAHKVSKSLE